MDSTANVPDVIRQEAKAKALKIIEANAGCVSYVKPEDLETQNLFVPVVSIIKPTAEEFHKFIPGIGILPKVPLMNTIAEKAGVNIQRTETSKRGEYIWVGHASGDKRMPDGSMRTDDASYEYDVQKRAELDFLKDSEKAQEKKYTTDIAKRKYILELCKFADQKAATGAQLALIHKLAKIPASFKTPEELMKGMIVSRIDRNVNGIMADPNMRDAIIQHALGATEAVFGPAKQIERTVDVESGEMIPAAQAEEGQADMFDDAPAGTVQPEKTPLQKALQTLEGFAPPSSHPRRPRRSWTALWHGRTRRWRRSTWSSTASMPTSRSRKRRARYDNLVCFRRGGFCCHRGTGERDHAGAGPLRGEER